MKEPKNPFPLSAYWGPDYFCNRKKEANRIISNAENGVNTTLISLRRMGKSGLIQHCFHLISKNSSQKCVYIDLFFTQNQKDFTNILVSSLVQTFPQSTRWGKAIMGFLQRLRPTFSLDPLSQLPQVSLGEAPAAQVEESLSATLRFLDEQNFSLIVALDEFQQIANYPEKNTEALLRSLIQNLKNVRFIFSGSSRSILTEMFHSSKRPFFASTNSLFLGPIAAEDYKAFIRSHFGKNKRSIDENATDWILEATQGHTYFVQALCNRLFAEKHRHITLDIARKSAYQRVLEEEPKFSQYRSLLTTNQWKLVLAIGRAEKVYRTNSINFLRQSQLGGASVVNRSLSTLKESELVVEDQDELGRFHRLADPFFCRWIQWFRR